MAFGCCASRRRTAAPPSCCTRTSRSRKSRGCPIGYRIGAVQTFSTDSLSAYAVLIAVRQYGFEGPDFRWIAVTGRL